MTKFVELYQIIRANSFPANVLAVCRGKSDNEAIKRYKKLSGDTRRVIAVRVTNTIRR